MYCCYDVETSGLNEYKHRLLSVAFVGRKHLTDKSNTFERIFYIADDDGEVDEKAMEINGIDLDWLAANGLSKEKASDEIKKFLQDQFAVHGRMTPVGQNLAFDQRFTRSKLQELIPVFEKCFDHHVIDTAIEAGFMKRTGKLRIPKFGLTSLTAHFGINHAAHNALADCSATLDVEASLQKLNNSLFESVLAAFRRIFGF